MERSKMVDLCQLAQKKIAPYEGNVLLLQNPVLWYKDTSL